MSSAIPEWLRAQVRRDAQNRCGYCLARQEYVPLELEVEHIIPIAKGGTNVLSNLWLACRTCNLYKGSQVYAVDPITGRRVRLFNPRMQQWRRHFQWSEDGAFILGKTTCGRANCTGA